MSQKTQMIYWHGTTHLSKCAIFKSDRRHRLHLVWKTQMWFPTALRKNCRKTWEPAYLLVYVWGRNIITHACISLASLECESAFSEVARFNCLVLGYHMKWFAWPIIVKRRVSASISSFLFRFWIFFLHLQLALGCRQPRHSSNRPQLISDTLETTLNQHVCNSCIMTGRRES